MKVIILAGGQGARLWPLSKKSFPKQFLKFGKNFSLLQQTVQRFKKALFCDELLIATSRDYFPMVERQLKKIDENLPILIEPEPKNTAPAIGLALKELEKRGAGQKELVLVVPSDHLIEPEPLFIEILKKINPQDSIVTFGIRPTKAETGYGYIELGEKCIENESLFKVRRFVEKPDLETAQSYLEKKSFLWNSGMFLFKIETFWKELEKCCFTMHLLFQKDALGSFSKMPSLSIDYAIMEKSENILVYPLQIGWSDVGSWDSVYDVLEKDQDQNVKIGNVIAINTKNSLIYSRKRVISTIGLEGLLVVETEDGILIAKKGESQRVKELLDAGCL